MRLFAIAIVVALLPAQPRPVRSSPRSICVAPHVVDTPQTTSPDLPACGGGHYSLKIDDRPRVEWPRASSLKIDGLDPKSRHRVVIQCDEKPHQSFVFRFSQFKSPEPCLFLNDAYKTAHLWEAKRAPWCTCQ